MIAFPDGLLTTLATERPTEQQLRPRFIPADFDGDTSDEALEAWAVYQSIPDNFDASPEQSVQDAFTAAFDLGRQVIR